MSYLRFDKTLMTNLQVSLQKEILRSNRSGAYSCSSIVDCNTRKYHGLLVVPIPSLDEENHVLLSSLDATVIQHGAEFNLGLHKYHGDNFSPRGHKYIREFDSLQVPTTTYRVGGVILKREQMFQHFENRIFIRYTLVDAHSDTTLRLQPFLAFRSVREYTHENAGANKEYQEIQNGIKTCLYPGYPTLYMQIDKDNHFVFCPDWYRGIEYPKEQERGYASNEDLYVPGYFELTIKKGESVVFSAGLDEADVTTFAEKSDLELKVRTPRDNFYNTLVNSAHQFVVHRGEDIYVLAGYPWFGCRARDMFVSLPGLTLTNHESDKFEAIMKTAEKAIREFMDGVPSSTMVKEISHPDVLLWAVWCIQQYANFVSREKCLERYGVLLQDIMLWLRAGKHPNLRIMNTGLVYSEGRNESITWMNSTANGHPIVSRTGYIVEFNALWYNALKFCADMCSFNGNIDQASKLGEEADKCAENFSPMFFNEFGYLCDYCVDGYRNYDVRPNMIFAVALDFSPLSKEQQKSVLDICTKELSTPKGLRSLSPKSHGYNPLYIGPQAQRDYAYHQGTAWPWLAAFYMEACLKVFRTSKLSYVDRLLVGYEEELFYHCIGTLPELFDGNPPFSGRGAISFAMNVAGIMRVVKLLDKYNTY